MEKHKDQIKNFLSDIFSGYDSDDDDDDDDDVDDDGVDHLGVVLPLSLCLSCG